MSLTTFSKFVYWAGVYNLVLAARGAVLAVTSSNNADPVPGLLIAGFLLFTAVIQIFGSRDLPTYGWAIFWEGILRWIAAALFISYGFFGHLGTMAGVFGIIDFLIGVAFLFVLPGVINKRPADLLAGK